MKFTILPAQLSDCADFASVYDTCFDEATIIGYFMNDVDASIRLPYLSRYFERQFKSGELQGARYVKAVEEDSGTTVGFAKWQHPHSLSAEQSTEKEAAVERAEKPPAGTKTELRAEFFRMLSKTHKKHVAESKDYVLQMLCVLPSYQRRGIGDMLVREGLAFADRDGARTYVEASPMGLPLYLRHGWKEVDENVIDMRRYGLDRIESGKCLMRAPGGE